MTWYGITVTAQNKPTVIALEARQARRRRGHATKSATFAVANGTATNSPIRISSTVCAHTATVATAKSRSSRRSTLQMRRPAESATGDAGGAAPAFSFIAPPLPRRRNEVEREPQGTPCSRFNHSSMRSSTSARAVCSARDERVAKDGDAPAREVAETAANG